MKTLELMMVVLALLASCTVALADMIRSVPACGAGSAGIFSTRAVVWPDANGAATRAGIQPAGTIAKSIPGEGGGRARMTRIANGDARR